jgi:hypothetical protein
MLAALPGEPIWLRQGVFLIKKTHDIADFLNGKFLYKPCIGIFLERKVIKSKTYVEAYVDDHGIILINEEDVIDMKLTKENI